MENLRKTSGNTDTSIRNTAIIYQLPILGLDKTTIKRLKGKRTLDLACGNGSLVEELRSRGVKAEGIDPRAPSKPYFTRRKIIGIGQENGIVADNESYNLITSFQNTCLNDGIGEIGRLKMERKKSLGTFDSIRTKYEETCERARFTISEIGRTLKIGGRACIFPNIPDLEIHVGNLLKMNKLRVQRADVNEKILWEYVCSEGVGMTKEEFYHSPSREYGRLLTLIKEK